MTNYRRSWHYVSGFVLFRTYKFLKPDPTDNNSRMCKRIAKDRRPKAIRYSRFLSGSSFWCRWGKTIWIKPNSMPNCTSRTHWFRAWLDDPVTGHDSFSEILSRAPRNAVTTIARYRYKLTKYSDYSFQLRFNDPRISITSRESHCSWLILVRIFHSSYNGKIL